MDGDGGGTDLGFIEPRSARLARVSLSAFSPHLSPAPRRLSSCFSEPGPAVPSASKKLAWLSLQGRLVGAEQAASASTIGGGLSQDEAAAWELFSPMQRVLIVAIVAAATAETRKSRRIAQLRKSVDVRDQVLLNMQQKLDDLCEQMNSLNDQSRECGSKFSDVNNVSFGEEWLEPEGVKSHICGHEVYKLNPQSGIVPIDSISSDEKRVAVRTDSRKANTFFVSNVAEQEERRMSDLSDFCSSVTSSMDIQFCELAAEQGFYNLQKDCLEKDEIIKMLTAAAHASDVASSKRITELEDMVRRKNLVITKMKKDMVILEQKVIQLTRQQRPSFVPSSDTKLPVMSNNLLYDMSCSSPSSSDSDCPPVECEQQTQISAPQGKCGNSQKGCSGANVKMASSKSSLSLGRSIGKQQQQSRSPLKENCLNHKAELDIAVKSGQLVSSEGDPKWMRKRLHQDSRRTMPQRRWV